MGFVYHANYLIWMDMARTEHLRERGMSYRDMQRPGESTVGNLAAVLAAADARRFDPAPLGDALHHPNPAVRRQGALAAGRSGDGAAVDLLLPVLNDSAPTVQAAAAFALGLLKDARALP